MLHKIYLRKTFHIQVLREKEVLGSSWKYFYSGEIQIYYVNKQHCSGALISQIKLIKQNCHQEE